MIRLFTVILTSITLLSPSFAQVPGDLNLPTQAQLGEINQMTTLMQEGMKPLTEDDVTQFLRAAAAYEKWVKEELPRLESTAGRIKGQEARMSEFMKRSEDMNNLIVLMFRVGFAEKLSDPKVRAEMTEDYTEAKAKMEEAKVQLAQLPAETRKQLMGVIEQSMALVEPAVNYPDASIKLYKKHEKELSAAMKRLEALGDKKK